MKHSIILLTVLVFELAFAKEAKLLSEDFIEEINSKQSSWVAGRNFPEGTTREDLLKLSRTFRVDSDPNYKPNVVVHEKIDDLPENFDARTNWPQCPSIGRISNQGQCGSCWAVAAISCITDRICIHSSDNVQFECSADDVMSCCSICGDGCNGGFTNEVFNYWVSDGIVSGGEDGCRPYTAGGGVIPACVEECQADYPKSYEDDKNFGQSSYQISSDIEQIQQEIFTNGPVVAIYEVFEDFYTYVAGVYQHTSGDSMGYHAVKVIGWGTQDGLPYWLVANSWGASWGEEGFFRIIRGKNECDIERWVFSGIPS